MLADQEHLGMSDIHALTSFLRKPRNPFPAAAHFEAGRALVILMIGVAGLAHLFVQPRFYCEIRAESSLKL